MMKGNEAIVKSAILADAGRLRISHYAGQRDYEPQLSICRRRVDFLQRRASGGHQHALRRSVRGNPSMSLERPNQLMQEGMSYWRRRTPA